MPAGATQQPEHIWRLSLPDSGSEPHSTAATDRPLVSESRRPESHRTLCLSLLRCQTQLHAGRSAQCCCSTVALPWRRLVLPWRLFPQLDA